MKKERSIKVMSNSSGSNRKEAVRQCQAETGALQVKKRVQSNAQKTGFVRDMKGIAGPKTYSSLLREVNTD
jgi:hypothetical protein